MLLQNNNSKNRINLLNKEADINLNDQLLEVEQEGLNDVKPSYYTGGQKVFIKIKTEPDLSIEQELALEKRKDEEALAKLNQSLELDNQLFNLPPEIHQSAPSVEPKTESRNQNQETLKLAPIKPPTPINAKTANIDKPTLTETPIVKKKWKFKTFVILMVLINLGVFFVYTQNYLVAQYAKQEEQKLALFTTDYQKRNIFNTKELQKIQTVFEADNTDNCKLGNQFTEIKLNFDLIKQKEEKKELFISKKVQTYSQEYLDYLNLSFESQDSKELDKIVKDYNSLYSKASEISKVCNIYLKTYDNNVFTTTDKARVGELKALSTTLVDGIKNPTSKNKFFINISTQILELDTLVKDDTNFPDGLNKQAVLTKNASKTKLNEILKKLITNFDQNSFVTEELQQKANKIFNSSEQEKFYNQTVEQLKSVSQEPFYKNPVKIWPNL